MITIKRLDAVSLDEALQIWNEGFSDYFVQIKMNIEMFTYRMAFEELSPRISVVAFVDDRPAGILLNGVRTIHGKRIAWNGGTSVAPEFRRHGVGKALVEAALEIYHEEDVELATLEAIRENEKAIALYEQKGYKIVDHLANMELKEARSPIVCNQTDSYQVCKGLPIDISNLPFYQLGPWQAQWPNLRRDGESLMIIEKGQAVGYLLYKRIFNVQGNLTGVALFQCEVESSREDKEAIICYGLSHIFTSDQTIHLIAPNVRQSNTSLVQVLTEAGFEKGIQQVYMTKEMK